MKAVVNRIDFLDNLRTTMIFLVIFIHAGIVYESSGFFHNIWIVDDPSTNNLVGILNLIFDTFVMPTIFFVSGYFVYNSARKGGSWEFVISKFKRIYLPWIIAVLILMPLYKVIFLYSRGLAQENWLTYFHWNNGIFSQNWLWFLPVLFLFQLIYLGLYSLGLLNIKMKLPHAIILTFIASLIYSFGLDYFNLTGWTKNPFLEFQNEKLVIYFSVFLLGSRCNKVKTFELDKNYKFLYVITNATAWIPISVYFFFFLYPYFIKPGEYIFSQTLHELILWFSFVLSMLMMVFIMVYTFKHYVWKSNKIRSVLSRNSYGVYSIHMIVLGAVAIVLLFLSIPSLLKYAILAITTFIISNLIVSIYRSFNL